MTQGNTAVKKLKLIESRLKELRSRLPNPDDYYDQSEYSRALGQVNIAFRKENKQWLLSRTGDKHSGANIGETIKKLEKQEKLIKKLLGQEFIGKGSGYVPDFMKQEYDTAKATSLTEVGKRPLLTIGGKGFGLSIGGKGKFYNPWYVRQFDENLATKDKNLYNQIEQDYLRGTYVTGMGSK